MEKRRTERKQRNIPPVCQVYCLLKNEEYNYFWKMLAKSFIIIILLNFVRHSAGDDDDDLLGSQ